MLHTAAEFFSAHISMRRRKRLDGELGQADAMPDAVLIG
jgi:hypothetical protein